MILLATHVPFSVAGTTVYHSVVCSTNCCSSHSNRCIPEATTFSNGIAVGKRALQHQSLTRRPHYASLARR